MAEFDNNNSSQYGSRENDHDGNGQFSNSQEGNNQNQYSRVPEYSFWAEQIPVNPNKNDSQSQASGNYQGQQDNSRAYYGGYNYYGNPYPANPLYQQNNMNQNIGNKKERKPGRGSKVFRFTAKAVCFGLVAGISFYGLSQLYYTINPEAKQYVLSNKSDNNDKTEKYEVGYTETGNVKVENSSKISQVTNATIPAIVSISSTATQTQSWFGQQLEQETEGSGSGIIVGKDEDELLIATNNHVVAGTNKIIVTFTDGAKAEAEIKGTDAIADLAVVAVDLSTLTQETLNAITVAKLGNSDEVKVGEMSIAIGNALGYGQSITVGYIGAKDREVELSDGYNTKTMVLLQTDAAINPGNSGGALLNAEGEVIGINTVKYASNEVEGMGFAIPISRATPIINELMSREILHPEEQGYLGIAGSDVTEEAAEYYNMPIGVYIGDLQSEGPAEQAGLRKDDIITFADDIEITSITQLRDYVTSHRIGTEVVITYMRNTDGVYEEGKVTVTLGSNPEMTTE